MKGNKKFFLMLVLAGVLAFSLAVVGCAPEDEEAEDVEKEIDMEVDEEDFDGVVEVGVIQPISGPIAYGGQQAVNGHLMAAMDINENGGIEIDGENYMLDLIVDDDEASPREASSAAQRLITQEEVSFLLGTFTSSASIAIAEVCQEEQIPQISPLSSAVSLTTSDFDYFFRGRVTTHINAPVAAKYYANLGYDDIALLAVGDDWGRGDTELFPELWEELGVEISYVEHFDPDQTDFYSELGSIADQDPDALFVTASTEPASLIFEQAREVAPELDLLTSGGIDPAETMRMAGEDILEGLEFWSVDPPYTDEMEEFAENYEEEFDMDVMSNTFSGYDTTYVMKEAMEEAGTVEDGEAIRDAMYEIEYDGYMGTYFFDERGESYLNMNFGVVEDGEIAIQSGLEAAEDMDRDALLDLYNTAEEVTGFEFYEEYLPIPSE